MTYIFNKNHNRTHLPGCRAISMMNMAKNAEIVEEPRGHLCGWCFKGTTSMKLVDHCLDEYCQEGT
jgi:hypothetical protein